VKKHTLSILVENHAGVLSRISGLFSRRGFNIDSLAVGTTEDPKISRITIVITGDDYTVEQLTKQLNKLIDVIKIREVKPRESVRREIALIKVTATSETRGEIIQIVDIFRANVVDVSLNTLTIELTGTEEKIEAFKEMIKSFGIKELVRTGTIALERGNQTIG
jgi:acetolactate synthase-1/3 small subunit